MTNYKRILDTNIENTVIIDINGCSEPIRVVGIYWPHGQTRELEDLTPFIVQNTLLVGDFNATAEEWNSPTTDARGYRLKKWTDENNLLFIPSTKNSSKRSRRHIDLIFTNLTNLKSETILKGSSDHWPMVLTSDQIGFKTTGQFPKVNWTVFKLALGLFQEFWIKESEVQDMDNWYLNYVRFLAALKNRVTTWKSSNKYRPSLPPYVVGMLKEVRLVRNIYYRRRKVNDGVSNEYTRALLRVMTRNVRNEINKYKTECWGNFLAKVQQSHKFGGSEFWLHLSKIYKPKTLPFSKLKKDAEILSDHQDITMTLYDCYKQQAKAPEIDEDNPHEQYVEKEYIKILQEIAKVSSPIQESITLPEMIKVVRKLKNKRSSGYDQVSNYMIKLLPPAYIECLQKCFNTWLRECRFPDFWKSAKIITLNKLKSGVPQSDQTRPISLLPTHSKLLEKLILVKVRRWAEGNQLIPKEQSGFRPGGLLCTRVLSIYQEIKNNLAANVPTLAIYVDYKKAYDMIWHKGLLVKLRDLEMPTILLKMMVSWLEKRQAYITFGGISSDFFEINIGLPQGSSLSPYLFIVYHCDLIRCLGAHSGHLFADDLSVLIRAPIMRALSPMTEYLEKEGTQVCRRLAEYAKKWKQPINVQKTVGQLFYTQIEQPKIEVRMEEQVLEIANSFKYLGFTWTNKLSLKPTIDLCLEKVKKAIVKLNWLNKGRIMSTSVLRQCLFAYVFPHLAWIFPLYPLLPKTQKDLLDRKFRVAIRIVHRCPYVSAEDLLTVTKEKPLETYIRRYIKKRLQKMHESDLGGSLFHEDIFYWDQFQKEKNNSLGQFFRLKRIKKLISRHESLLIKWIDFVHK